MEQLQFTYPGQHSVSKNVRVGNVGSGDLEVLLQPNSNPQIDVNISTSINHRHEVWHVILSRAFEEVNEAMTVTINDFGATPGVINLRLAQALEQLEEQMNPSFDNSVMGRSFVEMPVRQRCQFLFDEGSVTELLGCEAQLTSPWLPKQGIVSQSDDGAIVMLGKIDGQRAVVLGIEGGFQGGAIGEVSGAKMAAALDLALQDNQRGVKTQVVIVLETGGVRLQEANLGLAAIADIHSAIIGLNDYVPVVGIVAGAVGCFGGMSIAAGLCSKLIVTREARLGLNGPAVIEQEAGIAEYDASDRPFIWGITGGEQRYRSNLVDHLVEDDANVIKQQLVETLQSGKPPTTRSEQIDHYLSILNQVDTSVQATPTQVCSDLAGGEADE
ncbi:biotin-independent malonate decarboxylase subunit beta [Vibrio natriegens]|nr:biotin-independent malonate decarboxylase subunit beta [Vibrio natriegens]EPM42682.1 acetyl-CoA carboxylase [Vibrio natriegens NBRC 15636 = ATCC 14048 = DSM 759]MDX6026572.1 biotin-independent malonate decarboxylase subunit beta [Vibrio natriegens NBRC 15636 = ATCC 14048 = DSM 759]UUI12664.1 biotin-independent malonate decarboxylase subunit beta [Vibrio natriegens]WRS49506.1 biotin-independent malonate decarboxylase subunit beta [Vibrio natriegens NBRC 15636 = ATCC 14048 = DSM 759]